MKRSGVGVIIGVALTAFLAVPSSAYAANATFFGPIVPAECHCDNQAVQGGSGSVTSAPDYGCVLQVIQNIINFGVTLATILFTIYLVITGFAFMTSGGSPQARSSARTRFLNVFVGLAVLLFAARAGAQELGHRVPGTLGLDAGKQSDVGLYLASQSFFYSADRARGREAALQAIAAHVVARHVQPAMDPVAAPGRRALRLASVVSTSVKELA